MKALAGFVIAGLAVSCLGAAPPPPVGEERSPARPIGHESVRIIQETAQENFAGIALGLLAIEKSPDEAVRIHARVWIDDCVKLNKELMELARRKGILVPLAQIRLPREELASLAGQSGLEFEKAFALAAVNRDIQAETALRRFLAEPGDEEIRDFARQALADLGPRLENARQLGRKAGLAERQLNPPPVGEKLPGTENGSPKPSPPPLRFPPPQM